MIVVKLEMWPGGNESRAVEFGRMELANQIATTLFSSGELGDYSFKLKGGVYGNDAAARKVWKSGVVRGFNRRARGAWDLIFLALRDTVGDRNR